MFRAEVERLIAAMKALPREPGVAEILVPGERGDRTFERRSRDGIPISHATFDDLKRVANRFGGADAVRPLVVRMICGDRLD